MTENPPTTSPPPYAAMPTVTGDDDDDEVFDQHDEELLALAAARRESVVPAIPEYAEIEAEFEGRRSSSNSIPRRSSSVISSSTSPLMLQRLQSPISIRNSQGSESNEYSQRRTSGNSVGGSSITSTVQQQQQHQQYQSQPPSQGSGMIVSVNTHRVQTVVSASSSYHYSPTDNRYSSSTNSSSGYSSYAGYTPMGRMSAASTVSATVTSPPSTPVPQDSPVADSYMSFSPNQSRSQQQQAVPQSPSLAMPPAMPLPALPPVRSNGSMPRPRRPTNPSLNGRQSPMIRAMEPTPPPDMYENLPLPPVPPVSPLPVPQMQPPPPPIRSMSPAPAVRSMSPVPPMPPVPSYSSSSSSSMQRPRNMPPPPPVMPAALIPRSQSPVPESPRPEAPPYSEARAESVRSYAPSISASSITSTSQFTATPLLPLDDQRTNRELPVPEYSAIPPRAPVTYQALMPACSVHLPRSTEVRVHMKMLRAFHELRRDVERCDGLFGVTGSKTAIGNGSVSEDARAAPAKRWAIFIERAVDRFQAWWEAMVIKRSETYSAILLSQLKSRPHNVNPGQMPSFDECYLRHHEVLPPLDVLMVWHAYMMQPERYLEDCMRDGDGGWFDIGMPFDIFDRYISEQGLYTPNENSRILFTHHTGLQWNLIQDAPFKVVHCPKCAMPQEVPWHVPYLAQDDRRSDKMGKGFAEKGFSKMCTSCGTNITHDLLVVSKFHDHVFNVKQRSTLCHGTVDPYSNVAVGINKILLAKQSEVLNLKTTAELKEWIELRTPKLSKKSAKEFKKAMNLYLGNFTRFSVNLSGAVFREAEVIKALSKQDNPWNFTDGEINKLVAKYDQFMELVVQSPSEQLVPSLEVEIIWQTHMLLSSHYLQFCIKRDKRVIPHDEPLDEIDVSRGYQLTTLKWIQKYNDLYTSCTCWYCESIRENLRKENKAAASFFAGIERRDLQPSVDSHKFKLHVCALNATRFARYDVEPDEIDDNPRPERNMYYRRFTARLNLAPIRYREYTKDWSRERAKTLKVIEMEPDRMFPALAPCAKPLVWTGMYPFDPCRMDEMM